MSDDAKLKDRIDYGNHAEDLLNNPCYRDFKIQMRANLLTTFEATKFKDKEDRDEIWRKFQTLAWLEKSLERFARDGRIANETLLEKIKLKLS